MSYASTSFCAYTNYSARVYIYTVSTNVRTCKIAYNLRVHKFFVCFFLFFFYSVNNSTIEEEEKQKEEIIHACAPVRLKHNV